MMRFLADQEYLTMSKKQFSEFEESIAKTPSSEQSKERKYSQSYRKKSSSCTEEKQKSFNNSLSSCLSSSQRYRTKTTSNFHLPTLSVPLLFSLLISTQFLEISGDLATSSRSGEGWDVWWSYDGIAGPEYWGVINPEWSLCNRGRRQSPVDINPDQLLFDPTLEAVQFIGDLINGSIENTGRGVIFHVHESTDQRWKIIMNKGPLSYNYTLNHIVIHYGGDNVRGSEHTIDGVSFTAELQLFAFNSQLYSSWKDSQSKPNGVSAVSILVVLSDFDSQSKENKVLKIMTTALRASANSDQPQSVTGLSIQQLLPANIKHYMTYEGSMTQPSCSENVEWIILNKPIYISSYDMSLIRNSVSGYGDNFRPTQPVLRRCIRTNIDYSYSTITTSSSSSSRVSGLTQETPNHVNSDKSSSSSREKSCSINRFASYKSVPRNKM